MKHILYALILMTATACQGGTKETSTTTAPLSPTPTLTMTIDGRGFIPNDTAQPIPFNEGMKVRQAVDMAKGLDFTLKDFGDLGHLVFSINGLENNAHEGHYWQFCVGGVVSELGIDEKVIEAGQNVSWYYSAYGDHPCKKIGE